MRNALGLALVTTVLLGCNGGTASNSQSDVVLTSGTKNMNAETGVVDISNDQLQQLLAKNTTIIDIRRPEEWAQTGVVQGSHKVTFFSATGRINPILVDELNKAAPDKNKPVILICRTGNRTRAGSQMMLQLGYKKVYNVQKGITHWIAQGRSVVK